MKKFKKIILSALLLTFTFLSFHDYAVSGSYVQTNSEVSVNVAEGINFDMTSNLHDSIHNIFSIPSLENVRINLSSSYLKPFDLQLSLKSHIGLVLERPPLS